MYTSDGRELYRHDHQPSDLHPAQPLQPTQKHGQQYLSSDQVYFIIIAILQMIPSISVTSGTPTILFPLSFVMLAVLIKDAYEEF